MQSGSYTYIYLDEHILTENTYTLTETYPCFSLQLRNKSLYLISQIIKQMSQEETVMEFLCNAIS